MLRKNLWRIGWLLAVVLSTSLILVLGYRNLSVRFIADPRFQIDRQGLLMIHRNIPDSPRLNLRLADSYLAEVANGQQALEAARYHSRLAAEHSLWDYRAAHTLGTILEIDGDQEGAERALRSAVRLSPNYTRANWALGNLLVRQSRLAESLPFLANAARLDQSLYPAVFELLWEAAGGEATFALQLTAGNAEAQLGLIEYLLDRSQSEAALALFHQIDLDQRRRSARTARFIARLIEMGELRQARQLWAEIYPERLLAAHDLANGDFEQPTMLDRGESSELESLFDWTFTPSNFARIGIDTGSASTGSRSLRLTFVGKDTTTLRNEIRQQLALKPGAAYRLSFAYRTVDFTSPLGPRVAVITDSGIIAQSAAIPNSPAGTGSNWTEASFQFTAPVDQHRKYLAIIRQPQFSYDEPTRGGIWFDDFTLREIVAPVGQSKN